MTATFHDTTMLDTNRKTIIKFCGSFTAPGSDEAANTKIQGRNLFGALAADTNNNVLVSAGGVPRTNYQYTVARIIGDVNIANGYLQIAWGGATPATIGNLHGEMDYNSQENLAVIPNDAITPNGNITFTTAGTSTNSSYTIIMELHKNNQDFSAGQTVAPGDFNWALAKRGVTP